MRHIFIATTLLFAGCAKLPKLPGSVQELLPKVSFKDMKLSNVDFDGAKATFILDVANPHPVGLEIPAVNWDLDLADTNFLEGVKDTPLSLEAGGTSPIKIPVQLKWADVLNVASGAKGKDVIPFAVTGDLSVDTPLGPVKVPFSHAGDLPVLHVPKVSLKALRVEKLDLLKNTASLAVDIAMTSEAAAPIGVDAFDYTLKLSGKQVASGKASLPAISGTSVATLPIDLKLLELGTTVVEALTKKESLLVDLAADATLGTPLGPIPLNVSESTKLSVQ